MTASQSRIEQLEKWAKGLGYPDTADKIRFVVDNTNGTRSFIAGTPVKDLSFKYDIKPIAIIDAQGQWHPAPAPIEEVSEYDLVREQLPKYFTPNQEKIVGALLNKLEALEKEIRK